MNFFPTENKTMIFRLPCRAESCRGTILPVTAQETSGFCMPCFKEQRRKEQEEYIQKNRKVVNLFAGLESPIDVIKIFHELRPHDPLIAYKPYPNLISKSYHALNKEQIWELVEYATNLYKEKEENQAKKILSCLVTFTNADITTFLIEMINVGDYHPPFLFKGCSLNIRKKLLEIFLQNEDPEGDLFKSIVWLTEWDPDLDDKIQDEMKRAVSNFKKTAFTVKKEIQTTRRDGFKKSILGNINIGVQGEYWPMYNNLALNPVIQLAISDLTHIPTELEGIKYLCIYIHPNDAGALLETDNALVIRSYTNGDLIFIEAPELINQESQPRLIEFEKVNDYSSDYQYPSVKEYLSLTKDHLSREKMQYDWKADFINYPEEKPWSNDCKILGWPRWVQWPEDYGDSTLILQVDGYGLWDYGDSSTLYIFRNNTTKEFWGTIHMA